MANHLSRTSAQSSSLINSELRAAHQSIIDEYEAERHAAEKARRVEEIRHEMAFLCGQLGHSIEMFLRTYSKWLDGAQNDMEMARLETALSSQALPWKSKTGT